MPKYKLMPLKLKQRVLILGDGDLSWSLSFAQELNTSGLNLQSSVSIVATTFDSSGELERRYSPERVKPHVDGLRALGVEVRHGVDATNLQDYFAVNSDCFDRVYFNFPHWGGQGHIERNRRLLADFFQSVVAFLAHDGECLVALVAGQGGTPGDIDLKAPQNTWRPVEAAAGARLVLAAVEPFAPPASYTCSGRRGRGEGTFWLGGALTHVFVHSGREGVVSLYPPVYNLDVSFFVVDEGAFDPGVVEAFARAAAAAARAKEQGSPLLGGGMSASDDEAACPCFGPETVRGAALVSTTMAVPYDPAFGLVERRSLVFRVTYQSPRLALSKQGAIDIHEGMRQRLAEGCAAVAVRGQAARPAAPL